MSSRRRVIRLRNHIRFAVERTLCWSVDLTALLVLVALALLVGGVIR